MFILEPETLCTDAYSLYLHARHQCTWSCQTTCRLGDWDKCPLRYTNI